MTSIHMDSQPQPANVSSLNQNQTSNKFDEVERVRQRMDGLRKHHNESTDIYNRTQPIINDQMHEETMKYLKNGQVNGTKTKSQKPRAPKRLKNAQPNNNSIVSNNNTSSSIIVQTNPVVTSTTNGLPPQPNPLQQNSVPTQSMVQQPGHMQQITLYPPRIQQQQPMHMQHQQQHPHQMQTQTQQQHFKYQTSNNNMYQQTQQPTMQAQHQYQAPQQQPQQSQSQQIYSQTMQPQTHVLPQKMEQNHFVHQHFAQHHNHLNGNHHTHHPHHHHQQSQHLGQAPHTSLPNDLDLTLQAGLECDVDSLIKHEMSVEGQLDFNHDLLLKLDNHYQPHQ